MDKRGRTAERGNALAAAIRAVAFAATEEAQRQAAALSHEPDQLMTSGIDPALTGNQDLLSLHLLAAAGIDVTTEVVMQRRFGATWQQIATATGMTRQSAHERWSPATRRILDPYKTGELANLADPDARDRDSGSAH